MVRKPLMHLIPGLIIGFVMSAGAALAGTAQEEDMGFKSKDEDSIIKETATRDPSASEPDADADPTGFKSKDTDSMITETHTPDPSASEPDPDADPTAFQGKQQVGIEPTSKTE